MFIVRVLGYTSTTNRIIGVKVLYVAGSRIMHVKPWDLPPIINGTERMLTLEASRGTGQS